MWPSDDELLAAWRRLVADPDTAGAFAALALPPLEADLARQIRGADPHLVTEAADVTVAAFLKNPTRFDPARSPLPAFLRLAARRDLLNLRRAECRHREGRVPWDSVEFDLPAGNDPEEGPALADHPALRVAVDGLCETDRRVLELMLDRERATAVFAAVLGVEDRPADEQARIVKRAKDRVIARLKRAGRES
jgi:DNA-directed RNA polymerase specialized sigma24 family protein